MIGELIFWGVILYAGYLAFIYWANNPRLSMNWEDDEPDVTAGYSRYNESPLRLVKGDSVGEPEPYDESAFALDYDVRPVA